MHIGVFTYYYYPIINGVVLTIGDWKKEAQKRGMLTTIFTPQTTGEKSADPDIVEYPAVRLYRKLGITVPVFPEATIEKEIARRRISILHVHHPFYIGRLALFFKRKFGVPAVFTYHTRYSDYARTYLPFVSSQLLERMVTQIMARFINQCDAVTVATEALKHELVEKGVHVPIFIVPPGIDTGKFAKGDRRGQRSRLGIGADEKALLYVGRLAKEKNIYFLLHAFVDIHNRIPQTRLVLAGKGLEETNIRAFVRQKKIANAVDIVGDLSLDTIADVYAGADMFVYASQTETFGRVVVEAMAAGLPIVALDAPAIRDVLKDPKTAKLVQEKSPKQFARSVLEILKKPSAMRALGANAQSVARAKFDTRVSFDKLRAVYTSLLSP